MQAAAQTCGAEAREHAHWRQCECPLKGFAAQGTDGLSRTQVGQARVGRTKGRETEGPSSCSSQSWGPGYNNLDLRSQEGSELGQGTKEVKAIHSEV
uniref:Uncharacterized protein n=1 Tax=Pongo abelii TaxID=9601 RepID=H2PPU0_PONAB